MTMENFFKEKMLKQKEVAFERKKDTQTYFGQNCDPFLMSLIV
jgi:hypothetical protein